MNYHVLTFLALTCFATPSFADWYEGGTLHGANFGQWQSASASNRLATASDWTAYLLGEDKVRQIGMSGLKVRSQQMANCVSEAASGTPSNLAVVEAASACAILMNW